MRRIQLGIAVKEHEYVKRLAEYIRSGTYRDQLQLTAFTNAEALVRYIEAGSPLDVLAGEPELLSKMMQALDENEAEAAESGRVSGVATAALVQKIGEGRGFPELLQYQSLPQLLQGFVAFGVQSSASSPNRVSKSSGMDVIAVYAAVGGAGTTTLSLHLAHAAAESGKRVFYLNLERWNSSEVWLDGGAPKRLEGMSELLYCLKAQPDKAGEWLAKQVMYHAAVKVSYIAPCSNPDDRLQLTGEDARSLLDAIAASQQYDLLICDMDDELSELQLELLEHSNIALWLAGSSASAQRKQMKAVEYGRQKWGDRFTKLSSKAQLVLYDSSSGEQSELEQLRWLRTAPAALPEVAQWRGARHAELLSAPVYRAAAERLLRALLGEESEYGTKR